MKFGQLDVLPHGAEGLGELAVRDVEDAGSHHQSLGYVTRLHERPEVLPREVRGEGLAEGVEVRGTVLRLDGGAEGDELSGIVAPLVVVHIEPHAHHAVGAELLCFLLHPGHGEFPCRVHRLGELAQLLALAPLPRLDPDVVDRRAHHEAEWVEAGLLDEEELVDREVRGEEAVLELFEAVGGVLGEVGRLGYGWLGLWIRHDDPPITMFSSAWRVCSLVCASAWRVESSRVSQTSIPTCSLRMRMPPEAWPMLQRTEGPSTVASRVSSPRMIRTDLISSLLRKRPPARSTARRFAQGVGELLHQQLEHDAQVGAVRGQLRDSHAEVKGGVGGVSATNGVPSGLERH